jgi:hypothetical protein
LILAISDPVFIRAEIRVIRVPLLETLRMRGFNKAGRALNPLGSR